MILPPLQYRRPASVEGAVRMLDEDPGAAVLAGGQTLLNMLKLDLAAPTALVDVHRLPELRLIEVTEAGVLRIGAAVVYAEIARSPIVGAGHPSVAAMAAGLVDRQVRNRGTIGGNCCLNDPTSNFPPLLLALDATFLIDGAAGQRRVAAEDFFVGTLATSLRPGELLTAIEIPPLRAGTPVEHQHLQVGADSWAMARAIVRLDVSGSEDGPRITDARVVLGAVINSPQRLRAVEEYLIGRPCTTDVVETASALVASADFGTVGDVHASAGYRREMAEVQVRRALITATEGRQR